MDIVEQFIRNGFLIRDTSINSSSRNYIETEGGELNKFITCDISGNTFEVPALVAAAAVSMRDINNLGIKLMPVHTEEKRTVRAMLNLVIRASARSVFSLCKITHGQLTYYALPGILLDKDKNILCMCNKVVNRSDDRPHYIKNIFRVSPEVFAHPDNIIEKTIIKKFIPTCSSIQMLDSCGVNYSKIITIIEDCSNWVTHLKKPSPTVNEDLNNILKQSV